jgi:cytochrome c2
MKRTIFVVLTVVAIVALMSGTAFAAGRYNAVYLDPTAGASPHGTYSTATNKCAVCHAVHNPGGISALSAANKAIDANRDAALAGSEVLLRDDVANACSYCHVSNTFAIKTVYAETETNYTDNTLSNAHNTNGGAMSDTGVNCTNCHQVHGAAAMMATDDLYMVKKILKFDAGNADDDAPAIVANTVAAGANGANMSSYCSQCHRYYQAAGYNGDSHTMRADSDNYANGSASTDVQGTRVAWAPSTYCRSCHQDGVTDQPAANNGANNYPHFTGGYRFLREANSDNVADAASTGMNDGNCTICHAGDDGSGNTVGVGLSF